MRSTPSAGQEAPAPPASLPDEDPPPPTGDPRAFKRPPDYKEKAGRLADALRKHRFTPTHKGGRVARLRQLVQDGASIMQLIPLVAHRHFEILLLALSGTTSQPEIAKLMGMRDPRSVGLVLKRPEIVYMRNAILRAQLEKVIAGEFGAKAAAKAAAPDVMAETIKIARGQHPDAKVSDQLRAGETTLKVAGEMTAAGGTVTHHHLHALLKDMTPEELRVLGEQNVWPARLAKQAEQLKLTGPA